MANVIGGPVLAHVQAFADELAARFNESHISTYGSHQPTRDRALDNFIGPVEGDRAADWAIDKIRWYGVDYIIWEQAIYNPDVSPTWRRMADRGSKTANHYDHIHVSFDPTGAAGVPNQGDDELTNDEKAALGRIDQRVQNVEEAVARLDPEINEKLDAILAKMSQ